MPDIALPAATAPPADLVRAVLIAPEVGRKLLAQARVIIHRPEIDPVDVVQIATARALANAHKFTPERGSVTVWLAGFVRHVAQEEMKKAAKGPKAIVELDRLPARSSTEVDLEDLRAALHQHLAELPEKLRRAVELRHLEGLEYTAVAAALGTTEDTARQRVHRGLNLLRVLATKEASS